MRNIDAEKLPPKNKQHHRNLTSNSLFKSTDVIEILESKQIFLHGPSFNSFSYQQLHMALLLTGSSY